MNDNNLAIHVNSVVQFQQCWENTPPTQLILYLEKVSTELIFYQAQ